MVREATRTGLVDCGHTAAPHSRTGVRAADVSFRKHASLSTETAQQLAPMLDANGCVKLVDLDGTQTAHRRVRTGRVAVRVAAPPSFVHSRHRPAHRPAVRLDHNGVDPRLIARARRAGPSPCSEASSAAATTTSPTIGAAYKPVIDGTFPSVFVPQASTLLPLRHAWSGESPRRRVDPILTLVDGSGSASRPPASTGRGQHLLYPPIATSPLVLGHHREPRRGGGSRAASGVWTNLLEVGTPIAAAEPRHRHDGLRAVASAEVLSQQGRRTLNRQLVQRPSSRCPVRKFARARSGLPASSSKARIHRFRWTSALAVRSATAGSGRPSLSPLTRGQVGRSGLSVASSPSRRAPATRTANGRVSS